MEDFVREIDKAGNWLYRYRFIIAIIVLIVLVLMNINGSSMTEWNYFFGRDESEGVLFGNSQVIRGDEYMVSTMFTFSQYKNNFGFTTNLLGGADSTSLFLISGRPVKDISMLFNLFVVCFLFLNPERGLAFFWWSRIIALFLATLEFTMLITNNNKKLSFIGTILIAFSPVVHWWYATNYLIEMIVFAEVAIVLINKFFKEENSNKRILYSTIITLCIGNYIFCIYPAWIMAITYMFLPILIWVFYENRKNIKFSKKEIFILILEILLLITMSARILIKSKDVIVGFINTIYPAQRLESGGGFLLSLLSNSTSIFFPYVKLVLNSCFAATFMDFWPITLIIVVAAIKKFKVKDFLLYGMCIVSVFLEIYCIFGIPMWLSKITLLTYSTAERVYEIVGLVNIFILIRLLYLLKENCFTKRVNILITIVVTLITTFAMIAQYNLLKRDAFIIYVIVYVLLISPIYFLILQAKDKKYEPYLIIMICLVSIIATATINPIIKGAPILESELGKKVEIINKQDEGLWVAEGMSGQFLIPFGARTLNTVHIYPNLEIWKKLDTENKFEEIYNRYARVYIEIIKDKNVNFRLLDVDTIGVYVGIDNLSSVGVKYICTNRNYDDNSVDTDKHKLEKIECADNFNIYKIIDN